MKPSPKFKIIHHFEDCGFDVEFIDWKSADNPMYSGLPFQYSWWWEGTRRIIRDAHKIIKVREVIPRKRK